MPQGDMIAGRTVERSLQQRVAELEQTVKQLREDLIAASKPNVTYTVTNALTDRTYNADSTSVAELADILATLLSDIGLR